MSRTDLLPTNSDVEAKWMKFHGEEEEIRASYKRLLEAGQWRGDDVSK